MRKKTANQSKKETKKILASKLGLARPMPWVSTDPRLGLAPLTNLSNAFHPLPSKGLK